MIYCDTSLIIASLTAEIASEAARDWIEGQTSQLAVSRWTNVEVLSALAMKQRRGVLDTSSRLTVESVWLGMQAALHILPVGERSFALAATLIDSLPRGLRAGDALHLAIAVEHGCEMATLDRDMADAARQHGMTVHAIRYPAT